VPGTKIVNASQKERSQQEGLGTHFRKLRIGFALEGERTEGVRKERPRFMSFKEGGVHEKGRGRITNESMDLFSECAK